MQTDEMGNEVEEFKIWHVEAVCLKADLYPSLSASLSREEAEKTAAVFRAAGDTWCCVRITGPHPHFRPKKMPERYGPRCIVAADLGL